MISVPIRGGFGTQLLSIIGALGYYRKDNIHQFRVHVGGYTPEYRALAIIDTLNIQNLFSEQLGNIDFAFVDGVEKYSIFREPYLSSFLINARKIFPYIPTFTTNECIIHKRTRDRQLLSHGFYQRLISERKDYVVIEDKGDFLEDVNSTKKDWLRIVRAKRVVGAYSTFTLSAAILNPALQLQMVLPLYYDGPDGLSEEDINAIYKIVNGFDNIKWINKIT
jgi:hypothetical protein